MEQTLKSEITRLARKQLRATYLPLARDVRRLERTVSAMRKTVAVSRMSEVPELVENLVKLG